MSKQRIRLKQIKGYENITDNVFAKYYGQNIIVILALPQMHKIYVHVQVFTCLGVAFQSGSCLSV